MIAEESMRHKLDFSDLRSRLFLEVLGEKCEVLASVVVKEILREAGVVPNDDLNLLLVQFDSFVAGYKNG